MTQLTSTEFKVQTAALYPTNGSGQISATDLRTQMDNIADSAVFNITAKTVAPTATDDGSNTSGNGVFKPGNIWVDETNDTAYVNLNNSTSAAIWVLVTPTSQYDIHFGFTATPLTDAILSTVLIPREVTFVADLAGSLGLVGTNPTASFDILVKDDGTTIGTITVATGGAVTFVTAGGTAKVIAAGSTLTLVAPTVTDASVADSTFVLFGTA